jgi:DNA-binding transcriptional ArsR family regulator
VDVGAQSLLQHPIAPNSIFNLTVDDHADEPDSPRMTDRLDLVFAALADPTRRRILAMLLEDDMAVTDVADPFEMSLAAISKHLGVLAEAGLISRERRGRVIWCKLEPDAMRDASTWMQGFGQFDPLDLDAFERFLAEELGDDTDQPELETVTVAKATA